MQFKPLRVRLRALRRKRRVRLVLAVAAGVLLCLDLSLRYGG